MPNNKLSTVIYIEPSESRIHICSMVGNDYTTITHETHSYKARLFDDEFFKCLGEILQKYAQSSPSTQAAKVTLVLPNSAVINDTVSIPMMKRFAMEKSLSIALDGIYQNSKDLKINRYLALQNKQYATYAITAIRQALLAPIYGACSTSKMLAETVTYSANTAVNAVLVLNPKLKNSSFLLLDMKDKNSCFSFVAKGRTTGYYSLPFGTTILRRASVVGEDMLFDHSLGELMVINAKEKARAKQLTMMGADNSDAVAEANSDAFGNDTDEDDERSFTEPAATASFVQQPKTMGHKTARKLPKFMLRPVPDSQEGITYENFRIFVKWALTLIAGNEKLTSQGMPECVYVNMPSTFSFLFDMVNEEKEENKIQFLPLDTHTDNELITRNLEIFGGFFTKQFNHNNNF